MALLLIYGINLELTLSILSGMVWIETPRLILRNFQPEDVVQLAPIFANHQVMKFSHTGILTVLQTQKKIDTFINSYKTIGFGKWAVIFKDTNQLIGYCGIALEQIESKYERELGYRLAPKFWGQGLATEAASATIQYGFEQLKFPYILGIVEPKNKASVKLLDKLGMRYERKTIFGGIEMDVYRLDANAVKK